MSEHFFSSDIGKQIRNSKNISQDESTISNHISKENSEDFGEQYLLSDHEIYKLAQRLAEVIGRDNDITPLPIDKEALPIVSKYPLIHPLGNKRQRELNGNLRKKVHQKKKSGNEKKTFKKVKRMRKSKKRTKRDTLYIVQNFKTLDSTDINGCETESLRITRSMSKMSNQTIPDTPSSFQNFKTLDSKEINAVETMTNTEENEPSKIAHKTRKRSCSESSDSEIDSFFEVELANYESKVKLKKRKIDTKLPVIEKTNFKPNLVKSKTSYSSEKQGSNGIKLKFTRVKKSNNVSVSHLPKTSSKDSAECMPNVNTKNVSSHEQTEECYNLQTVTDLFSHNNEVLENVFVKNVKIVFNQNIVSKSEDMGTVLKLYIEESKLPIELLSVTQEKNSTSVSFNESDDNSKIQSQTSLQNYKLTFIKLFSEVYEQLNHRDIIGTHYKQSLLVIWFVIVFVRIVSLEERSIINEKFLHEVRINVVNLLSEQIVRWPLLCKVFVKNESEFESDCFAVTPIVKDILYLSSVPTNYTTCEDMVEADTLKEIPDISQLTNNTQQDISETSEQLKNPKVQDIDDVPQIETQSRSNNTCTTESRTTNQMTSNEEICKEQTSKITLDPVQVTTVEFAQSMNLSQNNRLINKMAEQKGGPLEVTSKDPEICDTSVVPLVCSTEETGEENKANADSSITKPIESTEESNQEKWCGSKPKVVLSALPTEPKQIQHIKSATTTSNTISNSKNSLNKPLATVFPNRRNNEVQYWRGSKGPYDDDRVSWRGPMFAQNYSSPDFDKGRYHSWNELYQKRCNSYPDNDYRRQPYHEQAPFYPGYRQHFQEVPTYDWNKVHGTYHASSEFQESSRQMKYVHSYKSHPTNHHMGFSRRPNPTSFPRREGPFAKRY